MTDEIKTEVVEVVETAVPVIPEKPVEKDPKESHKELQGERKTSKKKVNRLNIEEVESELKRLDKAGHGQSQYYRDIVKHQRFLLSAF